MWLKCDRHRFRMKRLHCLALGESDVEAEFVELAGEAEPPGPVGVIDSVDGVDTP